MQVASGIARQDVFEQGVHARIGRDQLRQRVRAPPLAKGGQALLSRHPVQLGERQILGRVRGASERRRAVEHQAARHARMSRREFQHHARTL
mgnify:CR=1 FL=1